MPTYFRKKSRLKMVAQNNLGIVSDSTYDRVGSPIMRGDAGTQGGIGSMGASDRWRNDWLNELDQYYENRQYDHLPEWDEACSDKDNYVAIRKRKPRIKYPFSKVLASRVASKLVGLETFPSLNVENEPDDAEFVRMVLKASRVKSNIIEPIRKMLAAGSVFVRFFIVGSAIRIEHFKSKYCYPKFGATGELEEIEIRYVYSDEQDKDSLGNPKQKWHKTYLSITSDIRFDNPEYKEGVKPDFEEVARVDHNLGFVQGEWFRTSDDKHSPDGYSMIEDLTDFIDEICYSLSQSSQATAYNQDPQVVFKGMDEDDIDKLIRSSEKAWNLGKAGEASMLEGGMTGVDSASTLRDLVRRDIGDIARIALLDPEKMVASAQSGEAMKVLHGPMVELINELRPMVEDRLISMMTKISVTILALRDMGVEELPVMIPPGWQPATLDITISWPPIFPMTLKDLQAKISLAGSAKSQGLIAPDTAIRYVAKDFGVEDVEEEMKKIDAAMAAAAALNPFGGF